MTGELPYVGSVRLTGFHCIMHPQAGTVKLFALEREEVTDILISRNSTNHHQSQHFLEEFGSEYNDAVCYTAVRWLTKSAVLSILTLFATGNRNFHDRARQTRTIVI